ncbi:MAG TPA: MotA/TolQ/ExbB proton channel family protein, partial [Candidatus Polarisedimenticolia bacterium]|nr:MotA/TolQ/ExbB proton channel family protein [Candidatus Polarisedimenticolia bacterium]
MKPMLSMRALPVLLAMACGAVAAQQAPASAPLAPVAGGVREDLEKSLQQLTDLRKSIEAEKVPLAKELGSLETKLRDMKQSQESTSRSNDETILEVGQLKEAVRLRGEEAAYVSNLLDEYARNFESTLHMSEVARYTPTLDAAKLAPLNKDLSNLERLSLQADVLKKSMDRLEDLLGGARYPGKAVGPTGQIAEGSFAMIGPVVLFAAKEGKPAGLAILQAGSSTPAVRPLEKESESEIAKVVQQGHGTLPLDPTRGGALRELIARGSLFGYFKKGGPIMYPLLFASLLACTVILERLFFLAGVRKGRDSEAVQGILANVEAGNVDGAIRIGKGTKDFVARTLIYALAHREKSLSSALMRASAQELVRFNRGISILDTVITMAPLLGLLGTVTGMMGSFGMLGGAELSAPAQITGGIAEALIATAFGLGIAITSLVPLNYLHSKCEDA